MGRIRKASETDMGRMARDEKTRRTGKKLAEERGKCIACVKYSKGARYVDLGGELPKIGRLYICSSCVDRCRQVLGYVSQSSHENLVAKNEQAEAEIDQLKDEIEKLRQQLDSSLKDVLGDALLRARDIEEAA